MARQKYQLQISYKGPTCVHEFSYSDFIQASNEFLLHMDHPDVNGLRLYSGSRLIAELRREYFKEMEEACCE